MKKYLFVLFGLSLLSFKLMAQEYISPSKYYIRGKITINFLYQYRLGSDGFYHYFETNGVDFLSNEHSEYSTATEGLEHFYCYDNNSNMFYYYTENTIGYYNPDHPNYIKFIKNCMKDGHVKKVKEDEALLLTRNVLKKLKEKYNKKNDSIAELKRIARERFVKDSIETAQKKVKEQEAYRLNHDWRDLAMSKAYSLECEFCDSRHYMKNYRVMSISADTLYYLLEKPDMSYLGINFVGIHFSALTTDFKNDKQFKEYISIWRDSIANNNSFSNKDAAIFNLIQYNEFKDKVCKVAPNGFIQKWGWELNSADGIEPYFCFFNTSKKTIKYVDFYFSVFNAVGDKCYLKYDKSYIGNVRGVGPVEPFYAGSWNWERATHYTSGDASEMRIVKLVITYMDGTVKTIPRDAIVYENN